ncbi:hypothetical protein B0T24DRAFT_623217 [Lasiosphaeria ovina]|uniref:Uncharacterized protein n=1 Tax=Lasiosphaeria ovina TaxID=92902 RepID=A0AAE0N7A6_9PEZI|nr:hypothetical protein B0T24DRAFT_623217 [Lasiosphaeria ovina]
MVPSLLCLGRLGPLMHLAGTGDAMVKQHLPICRLPSHLISYGRWEKHVPGASTSYRGTAAATCTSNKAPAHPTKLTDNRSLLHKRPLR